MPGLMPSPVTWGKRAGSGAFLLCPVDRPVFLGRPWFGCGRSGWISPPRCMVKVILPRPGCGRKAGGAGNSRPPGGRNSGSPGRLPATGRAGLGFGRAARLFQARRADTDGVLVSALRACMVSPTPPHPALTDGATLVPALRAGAARELDARIVPARLSEQAAGAKRFGNPSGGG